ncbi:MAG: hypothetical protein CVU74_08770 [Deltaproteobacteria bacterium HGW-Deltaproteobacteria-9]|nr:MAG: hypothetical protein CVU74_08770 [Deltaproteobacteria bacterium HGW-Deltaproteobacteria-9]
MSLSQLREGLFQIPPGHGQVNLIQRFPGFLNLAQKKIPLPFILHMKIGKREDGKKEDDDQ